MRIRCLNTFLTEDQRSQIGLVSGSSVTHALTPGREYVVLGLAIEPKGAVNGSGMFVYVANDWGQCRAISIRLFEILDARSSRYWRVKEHEMGAVLLWPEEFYAGFFLDDLIEGDETARDTFKALVQRFHEEDAPLDAA